MALLGDDRRASQRAYRADFVEIDAPRVAIGGAEDVEAGKTETCSLKSCVTLIDRAEIPL